VTDWANRSELRHLARPSHSPLLWGLFVIGAGTGLASLVLYGVSGYGRSMLLLWLVGLVALSFSFWTWSRVLPRISKEDLFAPAGLAVVLAPLYLLALYRWPVQVSSDEVTIIDVAKSYAHPHGVDPFGVSTYLSRPTLLFIGWGKLGELFGGFDLYHMRLLHAVFGLLTIVASYALLRQLLPRWWAVFATCVLGASHAFFMISRLAMRENTAVLVEVVSLALLLWGLRNEHALATFWGGVVAGLGFYVYFPARVTLPIWLVFLLALGLLSRQTFPIRRLLVLGSIAVAGFVLMATPILIAESHIPRSRSGPSDADPTRSTLMIYSDAREKQRQWVQASSRAEGVKKNIRWGLTAFNNKVADEGFIYRNRGHGFLDPLTGVLLWLGVGLAGIRLLRRRVDEGALLAVTGFLVLWLSFAFLVNKAPNYTRLLVTLPFVAYLVTEAVRWLAGRWRSINRAPAVLTGGALAALVAWNLAIAWDFVQAGRQSGEGIGSTGRYVASHAGIPDQKFYISSTENGAWDYYSYGGPSAWLDRLRLFAADDSQVAEPLDPRRLAQFEAQPPFALFVRREAWERAAKQLTDRYPSGRIRNITADGTRIVLEVPAA
jgi:4-amino-4-deoxy-L-arabinose transferase-like glycosyltransferase